MYVVNIIYKLYKRAGQPGALKLPHTQGPGSGPTILVIKISK